MKTSIRFSSYLAQFFLEGEMFQTKVVEKIEIYTGCPRMNVPDFRRVFFMLNYTDITQNTYVQS